MKLRKWVKVMITILTLIIMIVLYKLIGCNYKLGNGALAGLILIPLLGLNLCNVWDEWDD